MKSREVVSAISMLRINQDSPLTPRTAMILSEKAGSHTISAPLGQIP